MRWRDIKCNRAQCVYSLFNQRNEQYQICKCHVFVHASKALYQWFSLCMSHRETIHSRHILQLTLLASICVNIAVRTISNNQTCGVLKRGQQDINFINSEHAKRIDTELCLFLQQCQFCCADALHISTLLHSLSATSLWCFFSC